MNFVVPDFITVPGTDLVRAYCSYCEHVSRVVAVPTEREKAKARERCGDPHAVIYPNTPKGWERGCPRCRG